MELLKYLTPIKEFNFFFKSETYTLNPFSGIFSITPIKCLFKIIRFSSKLPVGINGFPKLTTFFSKSKASGIIATFAFRDN